MDNRTVSRRGNVQTHTIIHSAGAIDFTLNSTLAHMSSTSGRPVNVNVLQSTFVRLFFLAAGLAGVDLIRLNRKCFY